MKIGISLLIARAHHTGVENAALNLIEQLSKLETDDEFVIYADTRSLPWLSTLSHRVRVIDVRLPSQRLLWLWEHLFFLTDPRTKEVDIVHFPIGGGVLGYRGRFVLTMHDLKHYLDRELVLLRRHLLWRIWCKCNIKRAAKIITVSEYVKKQILQEFPIHSTDIQVVANGVDRRFRPCAQSQAFREKYRLPERYILFVGATSTNKNLQRAVDAITVVCKSHKTDHCFVIAGMPGEADASLKAYVRNNHLENTVRFLGYVDDNDLPQLYSNAALFLFPSITEGFGIPPLEAMRCAIPVVAAHASCLPEVLGDAAIWVDPLSVDSIAEGISTGLFDQNVRNRAIEKGLSRAEQFSWEKMALETMKVYREATVCLRN
jgi:glycosyltransferase involved in cell wall biosynthesis